MDNDLRNNGGGWEKKQQVSSALAEWRVSRLAGGASTVEMIKQAEFDRGDGPYGHCMITLRNANEI
jgi:hypothetical protein